MKPSTEIGKSREKCLQKEMMRSSAAVGYLDTVLKQASRVQGWSTQTVVCVKYEGFEEATLMFLKHPRERM